MTTRQSQTFMCRCGQAVAFKKLSEHLRDTGEATEPPPGACRYFFDLRNRSRTIEEAKALGSMRLVEWVAMAEDVPLTAAHVALSEGSLS